MRHNATKPQAAVWSQPPRGHTQEQVGAETVAQWRHVHFQLDSRTVRNETSFFFYVNERIMLGTQTYVFDQFGVNDAISRSTEKHERCSYGRLYEGKCGTSSQQSDGTRM